MRRTTKILMFGLGGLLILAGTPAAVGTLRSTHLITVTRATTAPADRIWDLWADVPGRTRWDEGLESIHLDGPFVTGATGEVTLKGQPSVRFEIRDCEPDSHYTDRFHLPAGATMDWQHTITEHGDGTRSVTFRVTTRGPSALFLAPVMTSILDADLPSTVDRLVALAEGELSP